MTSLCPKQFQVGMLHLEFSQQPHGFLTDVKVAVAVNRLVKFCFVLDRLMRRHDCTHRAARVSRIVLLPTHALACFDPAHFTYQGDLHPQFRASLSRRKQSLGTVDRVTLLLRNAGRHQASAIRRKKMCQSCSANEMVQQQAADLERVRPGTMWVAVPQVVLGRKTTRLGWSVDVCSPRLRCECCCFETNSRRAGCGHKARQ